MTEINHILMENGKPSFDEIEKELNDYKELLWQLSDEYKLNLGNAERKIEEKQARIEELQNKLSNPETDEPVDNLYRLGLPACIFDKHGQLISHNNKFKFLVELLAFEIEEINNISILFKINQVKDFSEKFENYLKKEEGLLQGLFRVENPFKGLINLVLRIYNIEEGKNLALFIELNKNELSDLNNGNHQHEQKAISEEKHEVKELPKIELSKTESINDDFLALKTEIAVFSEKFELFEEIIKSQEISGAKLDNSKEITLFLKKFFNLDITRNKLSDRLHHQFKSFLNNLNQKFPELTSNEEKHCLLIKAGLTYKEIAALMDISINGVKIARNRLRKKFELENETKTSDFIDGL